jgi:hypothetical protein
MDTETRGLTDRRKTGWFAEICNTAMNLFRRVIFQPATLREDVQQEERIGF